MTGEQAKAALEMLQNGISAAKVADKLRIACRTVCDWKKFLEKGAATIGTHGVQISRKFYPFAAGEELETIDAESSDNKMVVTAKTRTIRTLDELLKAAEVDLEIWEVERWIANKWEIGSKVGDKQDTKLLVTPLWQVKAWFRRKTPEVRSIEMLLDELSSKSLKVPKLHKRLPKGKPRRELEVSICDPHLGLHCFQPESQEDWSVEKCEQMVLQMIEHLIDDSKAHGPFERVILPLGNDFMHTDHVYGTTTKGTPQPEGDSWHYVFLRAEKLGIAMIDRLKKVAPVKVVIVPGNHDRQSTFSLGRVWRSQYTNDVNVDVDASPAPYKFHSFGKCLIGFEHGASITPIRLAALMANECRTNGWSDARFCTWHLGDQHRKGSSKPSMLEEQGVSIEYLPGLTPPNAWSKLKGYSWQQRAGIAFIWDASSGLVATIQANIDNYTGNLMR